VINRNHLALLGVVVLIALAGCAAPTSPGEQESNETTELPKEWPDRKVLDEDLREGDSKDNLEYRNATAGDEVQFSPKEMNDSTLPSTEEEREMVRYGRELMRNTSQAMPEHVGNELSCASCHGGTDPRYGMTHRGWSGRIST